MTGAVLKLIIFTSTVNRITNTSRNKIYIYRVYQNDWSGFEVDYIHKYGEQNYKY